MADEVERRLTAHLRTWLGMWPPPPGQLAVVGSPGRERPGWDGQVRPVAGVVREDGAGVLSVPPGVRARIAPLAAEGPGRLGPALGSALGLGTATLGRGVFRWSAAPARFPEVGEWVATTDPRVPAWLSPFGGTVLIAWDHDGRYGAGVGCKRHDPWGRELAVVTEEHLRGRGIARALVAQAAAAVLAAGRVPTYLHRPDNQASASVAAAAGFPDRGWEVLGLQAGRDAPP
ncbi:MAG TPA: GNAT family N-acetyltransferase [Acidimicrobiales bacterium]|nr:GNAT family N-acetyltransferase [Acidimicrobiales bacterium]